MRVLLIDGGREWRGGQRQVELLAAGLRSRGHEPLVVVTPRSPLHRHLKSAGIAVAAIPLRTTLDLLAVRKLRRLITLWRPALVHAHDTRSHTLALTALVGRGNNIPLVVTRRSARPPRVGPYGARVSRFIAISGAVRDALIRRGIAAERVAQVYPGVSRPDDLSERDWRAECGWPEDAVIAGVIGEFAAPLGTPVVEAIAAAMPAGARTRLRLLSLGGRGGGHTTLGGVAAFRAGFVHDIHRAICGLDLMWHSGTAEGLGTAVIDAMSFGVPCVAFDGGSVAEIITSGRNGTLVPRGDTAAFARASAALIDDPEARAALAAHGRADAGRFDPAHFVDGVLAVYGDLVEGSKV